MDLSIAEIRNAIPAHLFIRDEFKFIQSTIKSVLSIIVTTFIAYMFIPLEYAFIPVWILYALINGTLMIGLWVLGH